MNNDAPAIGIIGGSGLYNLPSITNLGEIQVKTPFGAPSDAFIEGTIEGRRVYFLARHARGHRLLPTEINHRANIWALRSLNVRWIIAAGAVGSLQEQYPPRNIVLPDQFFDRMSGRQSHTFFGDGIVAHCAFDQPTSPMLRKIIQNVGAGLGLPIHNGGTYVNMDGPAFSTRAESQLNHRLGFDVIGMTNLPEAKLAREAEIAYANICMITDFDSWRHETEAVTASTVIEHLLANADTARKLIAGVIPHIPPQPDLPEHSALDTALVTDKSHWPPATVEKLRPILARFLG